MTTTVPGAVVTGRVRSHDGWPVPDATVTLLDGRGGQAARAITDDAGGFLVVPSAAGPVTVRVTAAGCDPVAVGALVGAERPMSGRWS